MTPDEAHDGRLSPGPHGSRCRGFIDGELGATRNHLSSFQGSYDAGYREGSLWREDKEPARVTLLPRKKGKANG